MKNNMALTRRRLLQGLGLGVGAAVIGGHFYLNDQGMDKAPKRNGKILLDMHNHLPKLDQPDLVRILSSHGITGLSCINKEGNEQRLLFEEALGLPGVRQIDNSLASIESHYGIGYILRDQELTGSQHHILAVGVPGDYLNNDLDPRKAVEIIRGYNGASIINHPFVTPNRNPHLGPSYLRYRFLNGAELAVMRELIAMVDEVEIFNAHNINPTFGLFGVPDMRQANEKAEDLATSSGRTGVVSSDGRRAEQIKLCGIYLDDPGKSICTRYIVDQIKAHKFENDQRQYVSRLSFVRGMFL